jgi:hypothetical protein
MRNNANTELGWPAVVFLFAIAVFDVVLIGHAPKWQNDRVKEPLESKLTSCNISSNTW